MASQVSLLEIVQTIYDELGLNRPAVVVGSTDLGVRQIYALVNRELRELQQDKDWTALQTEYDLHVSQPITTTCDTLQNSYQLTNIPSTASIQPYVFVCNAQNIPVAARVVSVDSDTSVTLSEPATGDGAGVACVFARDTYQIPADFSRYINQTWWDRTNRWSLMGPDSPQVDQWHRSGVVTIGPRRHFRQIGPQIPQGYFGDFNNDFDFEFNRRTNGVYAPQAYRLWPPPGATDTPINIVFEYISSYAVISPSLNVAQPQFLADSDFCVLDAQMLILGAKWRFFQIKGFDYLPIQQEAVDYVDRAYANDGGAKTLSMSSMRGNYLISSSNVQDGSFPGPGNGPN